MPPRRTAAMHWRNALPLLPSSLSVVSTVSVVLPLASKPTASMTASTPRIPFGLADDGIGGIVVLVEVDRDHPVGLLRVSQAVRMVIDHENLSRPRAFLHRPRSQPHRAGTIDGDAGALADPRIDHRLIGGRQDVGQEQHLVVGQRPRAL